MLQITIPASEQWDESKSEFVNTKEQTLQLEHSLISISKWESKWCKPYLSKKDKTYEETLDYIKCMTITKNVDPDIYEHVTNENIGQIAEYINAPMTASRFLEDKKKVNNKVVTSELIYYWMFQLNIPVEFQKWHLNRLIALITVCNNENQPPKKISKDEAMRRNAALNAARRKKLNSKG